jgi:hypothetical protein
VDEWILREFFLRFFQFACSSYMISLSRVRSRVERSFAREYPPLKHPVDEEPDPIFGFLFLGFVGNICFNFLIQEMSYFNFIFGDLFGSLCGFAYAIMNNIGQLVIVSFGSRMSFAFRVCFACILIGCGMGALPVLAYFDIAFQMYFALVLVAIMGFGTAILSSAGFGLTALCSPRVRQFYNVGTSLPGVLALPQMLLMNCMFKNGFHLSDQRPDEFSAAPMDMATTLGLLLFGSACLLGMVPFYLFSLGRSKAVKDAILKLEEAKLKTSKPPRKFYAILADTLPLAIAVWVVMFSTMMVFPDQITKWKSSAPERYPGGEFGYQNLTIYMFQICDVLARFLVVVGVDLSPYQVKIGSGIRCALVPLIILSTGRIWIFGNDVFRFLIMGAFGVTYGILIAWGMVHGPNQVKGDEGDKAGYIMSFFLVNAILVGSTFAFLIRYIPNRIAISQANRFRCAFQASEYDVVCIDPAGASIVT